MERDELAPTPVKVEARVDDDDGEDDDEEDGDPELVVPEDGVEEEDNGARAVDDYVPGDLDEALRPRLGMVFDSVDDAFALFKAHAYRTGFHAVRRTVHTADGAPYRSTFTCNHGHARPPRSDSASAAAASSSRYPLRGKQKRRPHLAAASAGCRVTMIVKDGHSAGRWRVEFLDLDHNHEFNTDMVRFLKAYRELPESAKRTAKITGEMDASVGRSLSEIAAERRRFPTRPKRGRGEPGGPAVPGPWIVPPAQSFGGGDVVALTRFVAVMQSKKPDFIHRWGFDADGRIKNVFWTDTRMKSQCHYFGDVMTLESCGLHGTRSTVFIIGLIGVNNHGDSVVLGCALLSDDTKASYVWLLNTWLQCTGAAGAPPPEAITTPYSESAAAAVAEALPSARHRFCIWHIMKKLQSVVSPSHKNDAACAWFRQAVFDTVTVTEFEREWGAAAEELKLTDDKWLAALYARRRQWAPGYVNHTFWAGTSPIRSTERPEPYFDGFVMGKTTVQQFLEEYDAFSAGKLEKEAYDDVRGFYSRPVLLSGLLFEEQLADAYTVGVFQLFQDEIKRLMHVICGAADRNGPVATYVTSELTRGKKVDYTVVYNSVENDAWCICCSFQSRGVLCSHVLAVLKQENVLTLPSRYVVDRWRKDFKMRRSSLSGSNAATLCRQGHRILADTVDIASREPELKEFALSIFREARDKVVQREEPPPPPQVPQPDMTRVDMNVTTVSQNGSHSYGMLGVNLVNNADASGSVLHMAPTNFMQMHHLPAFVAERGHSVRSGSNKRGDMECNPFFIGGAHVG